MLRQALLVTRSLVCNQVLLNPYRQTLGHYGRDLKIPRHFSSVMIADWPEAIKKFLEKERINEPTAIQAKTLPFAMQNKDLVGVARTGSGKTLAFVIPAVIKILKERELSNMSQKDKRAPSCLVLAPTRELAAQTMEVFKNFTSLGIRSLPLVGGAQRPAQLRELEYQDHDVYIATPGRLMDLHRSGAVDLSKIKYLVLDEADRMLDMGFEPQIREILQNIPDDRQTLMWSATWPSEIKSLARDFMKDYEYVAVDSEKLKANPNIKQIVEVCRGFEKFDTMMNHLRDFHDANEAAKILIFVNTKRLADQLMHQLQRSRYHVVTLHGGRTQSARDSALRSFKQKNCKIMVATDVAARGLDINDITHVINYDFPNTIEDYIHRIGRTARHEKTGTSLSLLTDSDANLVPKLIQVLAETNQDIPESLESLQEMSGRSESTSRSNRGWNRGLSSMGRGFNGERQGRYSSNMGRGYYGERQIRYPAGNQRNNDRRSRHLDTSDIDDSDDYDSYRSKVM